MGATATISLDEYLSASYEPDMEFVDGALVRRNVGTQLHGLQQTIVAVSFSQYRKSHQIGVFAETRLLVDVASGLCRIPDVMVLPERPIDFPKIEFPFAQMFAELNEG